MCRRGPVGFGVVFVGLLLAAQYAPKFSEDLEPIAWSFPLALAGVFGFFTLMAIWFYFGVCPIRTTVGISQGVGLGILSGDSRRPSGDDRLGVRGPQEYERSLGGARRPSRKTMPTRARETLR